MSQLKRYVTQLPDRQRYRAVYENPLTGKPVTKQFKTRKEANLWLDEQLVSVATGVWVEPDRGKVTFKAFAEDIFWPSAMVSDNTRDQQLRLYRLYLLPRWGETPLAAIDKEAVTRWQASLPKQLAHRSGKPLSISAIRQIFWIFHKIVIYAVDVDYMPKSPFMKKSKLPTVPPKAKVFALGAGEVEALAQSLTEHATVAPGRYRRSCVVEDWSLMFYVMAYTYCYGGFRPSEGLALRVDDLNPIAGTVRVDEQYLKGEFIPVLKRDGSHRTVPISRPVMELLVRNVETNIGWANRDALLFTNKIGYAINLHNLRVRWFYPAVAAIGREGMTPHDMRHTAASAWWDEGFSIEAIADFLGDTVEVTRQTYVHMFQGRRDALHDRMDDRFHRGLEEAKIVSIGRAN